MQVIWQTKNLSRGSHYKPCKVRSSISLPCMSSQTILKVQNLCNNLYVFGLKLGDLIQTTVMIYLKTRLSTMRGTKLAVVIITDTKRFTVPVQIVYKSDPWGSHIRLSLTSIDGKFCYTFLHGIKLGILKIVIDL